MELVKLNRLKPLGEIIGASQDIDSGRYALQPLHSERTHI